MARTDAGAPPADVPAGESVLRTGGISIGLLAAGLELAGAAGRIGVRGGTVVLDTDAVSFEAGRARCGWTGPCSTAEPARGRPGRHTAATGGTHRS